VPIETIVLPPPKLDDVPNREEVVVSEKASYRLPQRPGSYVFLKRKVINRKDTGEPIIAPQPANVLGQSVADVSFLAGMLLDKCVYHVAA
jgi:transposase